MENPDRSGGGAGRGGMGGRGDMPGRGMMGPGGAGAGGGGGRYNGREGGGGGGMGGRGDMPGRGGGGGDMGGRGGGMGEAGGYADRGGAWGGEGHAAGGGERGAGREGAGVWVGVALVGRWGYSSVLPWRFPRELRVCEVASSLVGMWLRARAECSRGWGYNSRLVMGEFHGFVACKPLDNCTQRKELRGESILECRALLSLLERLSISYIHAADSVSAFLSDSSCMYVLLYIAQKSSLDLNVKYGRSRLPKRGSEYIPKLRQVARC